jgi:hypothetical protein
MAFVVCAITMYMLWWDKPFGVESRATITANAYDVDVKKEVAERLAASPERIPLYYAERERYSARSKYFKKVLGVQIRGEGELTPKNDYDEIKKEVKEGNREDHVPDLTWDQFLDLAIRVDLFSKTEFMQRHKESWSKTSLRNQALLTHPENKLER